MRLTGRFFAVLAALALAAPAAAQTYGNGATRGGYSSVPAGPARGGYGGPMRGGGYGVIPGLLLPAIAAGAAAAAAAQANDEPPPRRRAPPRQKIANPHPLQHTAPKTPAPKKPERKQVPTLRAQLDLPPKGETRLEPKEALVVFRPGVGDRKIAALARRQKLEPAQYRDIALLGQRVYRLRSFDDRPLENVLKTLARDPAVASVQANYIYALADDAPPAAPASQAPAESAAPPAYAPAMLHLPEAHRVANGKGVRVALIDSAIDPAHPEIAGSVVAQFDVSATPAKPSRHGAGMAGAIAGHQQIDGAAPAAQLLVARAFDETGDGARAVGLDLLAALDWAVAQKAQIVNMSFAGPADPLLARMLEAAAARGIILIAAAGNDGRGAPPAFPGADPHVIAVSALDEQSRLYDRANRGGYVALAAPGVDVLVAAPGGAYDLTSGTSVACAEVSGVAALLLEKAPGLDGPGLKRLLRDSALALKDAPDAGAGLADAQAALKRAR
jgi:subtilisin family serine protease